MYLSDIIYQLKLAGWRCWNQDCFSSQEVEAFSLWPDPLPAQPNLLYVADLSQSPCPLPWNQEAPLLLLCQERPLHVPAQVFPLEGTRPLPELVSFLSRTFGRWQNLLLALKGQHLELFSLMNQTAQLLDASAVLIDDSLQGFAYSNGIKKLPLYYDSQEEKDIQMQMIWDPDFFQTQNEQKPFLYENHLLGHSVQQMLCRNLFVGGRFYARFALIFSEAWKIPYLEPAAEIVGRALEEYFQLLNTQHNKHKKSEAFLAAMEALVHGAPVENMLDLNHFGWQEEQEYQIYQFRFDSHYPMEVGRQFLLNKLEEYMGECFLTERQTDILCVQNRSLSPLSQEDNRRKLVSFLSEYIGKAGISCCFHSLREAPRYIRQADWALKWGEEKQPTHWYHFFQDYTYEYLMDQCVREFPAEQLVLPALLKLKKRDQEKGSSLLETLETYVASKCNGQATAQKLFIHRTTFLYRMKQIREITHLDPQDWETYKKLVLSFELWRHGIYQSSSPYSL